MISYYFWFLLFGIIAYIIIVDSNVMIWLNLMFRLVGIQVQRFIWMIRLHPKNPIVNLMKRYEYDKIAKELEGEFKVKNK
jgi:hypothetical protein